MEKPISMAKKAKKSLNDLPEEMIAKILSPLSVKSLLICKSVCKTWLSIISNPHFVKSQLHSATLNPSVLFIKEYEPEQESDEGTLMTLDDVSPVRAQSVIMPRMFSGFPVAGSCHGILCLENISCNTVYLWNPSTRRYKRIFTPLRCKFRYYKLGFGYDPASDDYKVLFIVYEQVFVYSTNADSWRQFQDPILKNLDMVARNYNVVVNGVLYFHSRTGLISFDLHKEVFRLVPFPSFTQTMMSNILDYEASVAVFYESFDSGLHDLWILDNTSDQVSWTKKSSIDPWTLDLEATIWLSCSLGAGKFFGVTLLNAHDDFLQYASCDYDKRESKFYGLREEEVHATLKYIETLVSLDGFQRL